MRHLAWQRATTSPENRNTEVGQKSGPVDVESRAQQLCTFGHRWVVLSQPGCVLCVEILQVQWLNRQDLAFDTGKFGMALEDERCWSHCNWVIPADRRGFFAGSNRVMVALIESHDPSSLSVRVEVGVGQELPDWPNNRTRLRGHRNENVGVVIKQHLPAAAAWGDEPPASVTSSSDS